MGDSKNKVVKAGIAYTVGNVLLKGIAFLTLPIFTRLLTTQEFGLYNVYVSYESILTIFAGVCLYGSLRTAWYDYKTTFQQYVLSSLTLSFGCFLLLLIAANVLYPFIAPFFDFSRGILNILVTHSYAMFIFQFYNVRLALEYRYKEYLIVSAINSVGGTIISIFLILVVFSGNSHIARIYGYALVPIVVAFIIILHFFKEAEGKRYHLVNIEHWKYGLKISIPLVIHTFSQQVLNQFDRIMTNKMVNAAAVGVYGFIYTISNILNIIVLSLDNAWSVWFYEQLDKEDYRTIFKRTRSYVLLMNVLYIGFISIAPDVIQIAGTEEYQVGKRMIIPLAFAVYFTFLYSLPVHIEYFYKKTKYIAMGTAGAAGVNFILNYFVITLWNYQGAAWSTLVSYILLFIFHWFIAKKINNKKMFPTRFIVGSILAQILFSSWILVCIDNWIVRWCSMVVVLFILLVCFRKEVHYVLEIVPGIRKKETGKM